MRSKNTIKNIIYTLLLQILTIACGFIIPKLIIKSFGSSVNGLVTSITQFLTYITLLESGFGPVVKSILYKPIANKDKSTIEEILKSSEKFFRKISYIFIAYIAILCFILPFIVSNEFDYAFTGSLILVISISTFAEYYFGMTYRLYLQAEQKTYIYAIIQIATLVLNTLLTVILIHFGASIHVVKLISASVFVLRPIIQNIYVKRKYKINLKNASGEYKIKQKWDGLAQHIAYVINNKTDIVILTICANLSEVSVYYIYLIIINSIKNLMQAFTDGVSASLGDMIAKEEYGILRKNFKKFTIIHGIISLIVYTITFILIIPFVSIYTKDITDTNYIRPIFAYIMVIAKFIETIRHPYNELIKSAGHFKQTKIGAWAEAIINIVLSLILVWKLGIIGVAIGTIVAITIRAIELIYHARKTILNKMVV